MSVFLTNLLYQILRAAGLGLEPRYSASEADVLPLDDPANYICSLNPFILLHHNFFLSEYLETLTFHSRLLVEK